MRKKSYEVLLPVYKRGDDIAQCLIQAKKSLPEGTSDNLIAAEAFRIQAAIYESAATVCKAMASVAFESADVSLYGDTHIVIVEGTNERLQAMTEGEDAMLSTPPWDEEAETEYEGTEDIPTDEEFDNYRDMFVNDVTDNDTDD